MASPSRRWDWALYDLEAQFGVRNPTTLWAEYQDYLNEARRIVTRTEQTTPAYSSPCKMYWWYTKCIGELERQDDLTLISELGRSRRNAMAEKIGTITELAQANIGQFLLDWIVQPRLRRRFCSARAEATISWRRMP